MSEPHQAYQDPLPVVIGGQESGSVPRIRSRSAIAGSVPILIAGLCLLSVTGCLPALTMAASIIGGVLEQPVSVTPGPFSGAPSSSQNRDPSDAEISEALDTVTREQVTSECKARLGPETTPIPDVGCVTRPACLPGARTPMPLRLCAPGPAVVAVDVPRADQDNWRWDGSKTSKPAQVVMKNDQANTSASEELR